MRSRLGLAAIVSVLFALPAGAHHSHGNYVDSFTDITGVVKEVHLLLPHSWVYLEVKDPKGGEAQIWRSKRRVATASSGSACRRNTSLLATPSRRAATCCATVPTGASSAS